MNQFRLGICAVALLGSVLVACAAPEATDDSRPAPLDTSAFSGQWVQHAGVLNIGTSGDVDLTYQVEQPPMVSSFPELRLRLESVTGDTAIAVVTSSNDARITVGSTGKCAFYPTSDSQDILIPC